MSGEKSGKSARRPLGRGLSALFEDARSEVAATKNDGGEKGDGPRHDPSRGTIRLIDISRVAPHPDQPRRHFDDAALAELADSISTRGVIQPIIVRPVADGRFQIVAGERRWRAAQKAQLHQIPAIIREFSEAETLEIALVENIQREDLNPVEEAQAYRRLMSQFGHSQEALSRLVGKSRSHIANLVRLLDLSTSIQDLLMAGDLSMGHGRALIGAVDGERLALEIVSKGLSVRETERLVRKAKLGAERKSGNKPAQGAQDADIASMERQISDLLGLKVAITFKDGAGAITLHYVNLDQLDLIMARLQGGAF